VLGKCMYTMPMASRVMSDNMLASIHLHVKTI
jgi:hypothetical protein